MRSLINILDLSVEELDELIATANDIIANPQKYAEACHGKKLATLFFEPSTRTRLSFEAAMYELGGNVLTDAFGIVAMVAMMPLLSIQVVGFYYQRKARKVTRELERYGDCDIIELWEEPA